MKKKLLIALVIALSLILAAGLIFILIAEYVLIPTKPAEQTTTSTHTETTAPPDTQCMATTVETEPPTEPTTQPTTQPPQPEYFTLTFVGDCTLGTQPNKMGDKQSFVGLVGENYEWPFQNVSQYFQTDDCTFANLEGVFADSGDPADKLFTFRGPISYAKILTTGSVEAVSLANNHTYDFGKEGYLSTKAALDGARVQYAEQDSSVVFTTKSGLTIGLYAISFTLDQADLEKEIAQMRENGAEIIVVSIHCGVEGSYSPTKKQEYFAKLAIDLGADIVWGHHPHVLQKIESYNGGIIYYSLGNFSFGGNRNPSDKDSALLQQEVIRDVDGTIRLGELTIIPCSVSSISGRNNFQPTPYEEGTNAYERAMSKLNGTYDGPDRIPSYETTAPEDLEPPEPSEEDPTAADSP